jgi:hypothetical protein
MLMKEIFAAEVTRDIAPVIYFHEQDPGKVLAEVSEYIVTGGYPESDPRHRRIPTGIHEQFVTLLRALAAALRKQPGTELPAAWISGFYGSGKSSFAKLLGLALDGMLLPDHRTLAEALLARDDSPKAHEFRDAWHAMRDQVDPMAVVFDIGAIARDDEPIHAAVKRQVQARLGYCRISHYVAEHELKLELDGKWDVFCACAEETLGRPWGEAQHDQLAEEDFSEVMYKMQPDRYVDPMSWIDSRAGAQTGIGSSVAETTQAISDMLRHRAPGKTLFLVVDEVSQYIHQNTNRMLALQSFVADLGQKLKGQVWLFATGQQQLEDSDDESSIGKLKDRFPPHSRVHLAATNIRDVVHKRLLRKAPAQETALRTLFQNHRPDLKLYGYACEAITEEDFLEVYPLLPGHVDLLMQVTSNLRTRSTRVRGDDHAIRGLLQLLGELFRTQALGEEELGVLVTLDRIYEVLQSVLDADTQHTLARLFAHEEVLCDDAAMKVAKAVALLEQIQEQEPTTATLVSQCLYARLGMGNPEPETTRALDTLRELGLLTYSEKLGYKLQSSAGQEWQRERDARPVTSEEISHIVGEKLKELIGTLDRPRYKGKPFPWAVLYSNGRRYHDERLQMPSDAAVVTVDMRYLATSEERSQALWVQTSDSATLRDRLIWVVGQPATLPSLLRDLARSLHMVSRYGARAQSLPRERQRLFFEEQSRCEDLEQRAQTAVAQAFMDGELYYHGRAIDTRQHGTTFATVLHRVAEEILPDLYSHYVDIAITPGELAQLLEPNLSGQSPKFMPTGLGILDLDAGKYVPTCNGQVPARIAQYIKDKDGIAGGSLLADFGGPPYGHPADVIKACLAGLLRAGTIRIRPDAGPDITSVRDPGGRDMFTKDRDFKRADILPPKDQGITQRDRVTLCKFFKDNLGIDIDRENDAIADAVFQHFPQQVKLLQDVEQRYHRLPHHPDLPAALMQVRQALENSMRSRQVEDTVLAVKKHLDVLRDGVQQLGIVAAELTEQSVEAVRQTGEVQQQQVAQLRDIDSLGDVSADADSLAAQLEQERPWRDIAHMEPHLAAMQRRYQDVRLTLIERQEQLAQAIRDCLKQRQGFEKLKSDQSHHVLRPMTEALYATTPDALRPTLVQLRDTAISKLHEAEHEANERLDSILAQSTATQVIRLPLLLSGREVSTREEVDMLLHELRERLLAQLKENTRIRLV